MIKAAQDIIQPTKKKKKKKKVAQDKRQKKLIDFDRDMLAPVVALAKFFLIVVIKKFKLYKI